MVAVINSEGRIVTRFWRQNQGKRVEVHMSFECRRLTIYLPLLPVFDYPFFMSQILHIGRQLFYHFKLFFMIFPLLIFNVFINWLKGKVHVW